MIYTCSKRQVWHTSEFGWRVVQITLIWLDHHPVVNKTAQRDRGREGAREGGGREGGREGREGRREKGKMGGRKGGRDRGRKRGRGGGEEFSIGN